MKEEEEKAGERKSRRDGEIGGDKVEKWRGQVLCRVHLRAERATISH